MASTVDVQPIMDEIRRLAEERRRLLSAGQLPAGHLATSEDGKGTELPVAVYGSQANLLDPILVVPWRKGLWGWSVLILRRLLQKFLKPTLSRQTAFNQAVMESFAVLGSRLQAVMQARQGVDQRTEQVLEALLTRLEAIDSALQNSLAEQLLRVQKQWDRSAAELAARLDQLRMDLLHVCDQQNSLAEQLLRVREQWDRLAAELSEKLRAEMDEQLSGLRFQVAELGRRWRRLFWEESHKASLPSLPEAAREYYQEFDYFGFEERMRGDEVSIREKQRVYLNYFHEPAAQAYPEPSRRDGVVILDVGCGRGEFLELLREAGLSARGVDSSLDNILRCREKNLEVIHADALEYLASLLDESLAGIFACQFIEHLPVDYLVAFVRACFQKVRPGGKVIFETINPESLVAMKNFYTDLSHQKPIPAATARFLLESSGFQKVETLYLSPYPAQHMLGLCTGDTPLVHRINQVFDRLNSLLFGHQDYAVVATR